MRHIPDLVTHIPIAFGPENPDLAASVSVESCQRAQQCRLPCSVVAENCVEFSFLEGSRDAAQRWQWQVYRPLWQKIREQRLTRYFPGDRSADFIARLAYPATGAS